MSQSQLICRSLEYIVDGAALLLCYALVGTGLSAIRRRLQRRAAVADAQIECEHGRLSTEHCDACIWLEQMDEPPIFRLRRSR